MIASKTAQTLILKKLTAICCPVGHKKNKPKQACPEPVERSQIHALLLTKREEYRQEHLHMIRMRQKSLILNSIRSGRKERFLLESRRFVLK